jgi:ribosomal protein L37AE/L43A
MKTETAMQPRVCPLCGKTYTERPALSRTDNLTAICPDCGTRQALESLGVTGDEQEMILETIHQHTEN